MQCKKRRINMKQRTTSQTVRKPKKQKGEKKDCELGSKCPYQNEYQHQLEFNHDKDSQTLQSESQFASKNYNKLGGSSGKNKASILVNNRNDGPSSGTKLGGGGVSDRTAFLDKLNKTFNENTFDYNDPTYSDDFFCDACHSYFPLAMFVHHRTIHNTSSEISSVANVDRLRSEQDVEYNNSLVTDMKKQESERLLVVQERDDRLEAEDEEVLLQAIAESRALSANEAKQRAIDTLLAEPEAGSGVVQLKFAFPTGFKIARKFRVSNSIQDAFCFLVTLDECTSPEDVNLKHPVGADVIDRHEERSFAELGLVSNCNLVVIYTENAQSSSSSRSNRQLLVNTASSCSSSLKDVPKSQKEDNKNTYHPATSSSSNSSNSSRFPQIDPSRPISVDLLDSGVRPKKRQQGDAVVVDLTISPPHRKRLLATDISVRRDVIGLD